MDIDWNLPNLSAEKWALKHAGDTLNIDAVTKTALRKQLAEWITASEIHRQLEKRIEAIVDENGQLAWEKKEARRIAIQESTRAYAQSNCAKWEMAGYAKALFTPPACDSCRCYVQPWTMPDGSRVIVWYTAKDDHRCNTKLMTPWGIVNGCVDLHLSVVSEGKHLGEKIVREPYIKKKK